MELRQELRSRGFRLTTQRRKILDAVDQMVHATPDEIHAYLEERGDSVNVSTVYRTLELLQKLGLVTHAHLGHGPPTYHSTHVPEHVHLVCRTCETVLDAEPSVAAGMVQSLRADHGFDTELSHLTVFGTCSECRG
jgi:Fur family transcriptional regulator, ferric uptake regulator